MKARLLLLLAVSACAGAKAPVDSDGDGYPDEAELVSEDDRQSFLESFVAIALAQAPVPEASFEPSQRDCAGLVRYAYREALKAHDARFAARHKALRRLPEVHAFHYPRVPWLGKRLFRVRPGAFNERSIEADFDDSPEAVRLATGSARRVDGPARTGDLYLFHAEDGAWHLMIIAAPGPDPLLVYHTGPRPDGPGEVRRLHESVLLAHPDPAWHPRPDNPAFLGLWRLKIVGGAS
jgi:uncharacterized protein YfaT (DUF1175 family)